MRVRQHTDNFPVNRLRPAFSSLLLRTLSSFALSCFNENLYTCIELYTYTYVRQLSLGHRSSEHSDCVCVVWYICWRFRLKRIFTDAHCNYTLVIYFYFLSERGRFFLDQTLNIRSFSVSVVETAHALLNFLY